jgi:hypothetical protein
MVENAFDGIERREQARAKANGKMKGRGIIFLIDRAILGDSWTPIWRNSLL